MTDTFDFPLQVGQAGQVTLRQLTSQFGDGYAQNIGDGLHTKVNAWPCVFEGDNDAVQEVIDFLDAHANVSFFWTPPYGAQGYYQCAAYSPTPQEGPNGTVSFTLTQWFRP